MTTWMHRLDEPGTGPRVAVKDMIAVAGLPSTAGCPAYARRHPAAADADAAVIAAMRTGGARVTGTTTMHELACGRTGVNRWYGTARNPLDPRLIPGGSSSGSAVAVATGEADIGVGTDTGGSIRIPAACCGIAGLKTTHGLVPLDGVVTVAPSIDTVGFLARDVAGLVTALDLAGAAGRAVPGGPTVGRLRGYARDDLEAAVDRSLAATGWPIREIDLPGFRAAERANYAINVGEAAANLGWVLDHPDEVGADVADRLRAGPTADLAGAHAVATEWREALARMFAAVDLIALPTLAAPPFRLDDGDDPAFQGLTRPFNLAGVPALALPLPGGPGVSLQLVAAWNGEHRLLAAGRTVEKV